MNCLNIWYVYRVLICQIYIKGNFVANEFGEIFWGDVKINALKGGGMQAKRKRLYYFSAVK